LNYNLEQYLISHPNILDSDLLHDHLGNLKKVVTTETAMKELLNIYHSDSQFGGHSGINATNEKLSRSYYWKGIKEDVVEYVSAKHYN